MKRKAIDFTSQYRIEIVQAEMTGYFWSQLVRDGGMKVVVWEQVENCDSRAEALSKAEYALDSMTEAWLEEDEPKEAVNGQSD